MFIFPTGKKAEYPITQSLRLDGVDDSLSRTFGVPTNNNKFTLVMWVKKTKNGVRQWTSGRYIDSNSLFRFGFESDDTLFAGDAQSGVAKMSVKSTKVFRDPTSHTMLMLVVDVANATAADRNILYADNERLALASPTDYLTTDSSLYNQNTGQHVLGAGTDPGAASRFFDGYLSEIYFIDGQALTPSDFGEVDAVTGQWVPKKYTGTYGANGFYLDFKDGDSTAATDLGKDVSGNGNNWTLNNMVRAAGANDCWVEDTPTNNFATLDPLNPSRSTLSKGALTASGTTDLPTVRPTSGTWYFEISGVSKTWTPPAAFPAAAGDYNFGQRAFTNTPTAPLLKVSELNTSVITSGSFTGNGSADGPFVWMDGTPETLTIDGNAVTFGTHADKLANGFKIRTASSPYNDVATNNWTATILSPEAKSAFKNQRAKVN